MGASSGTPSLSSGTTEQHSMMSTSSSTPSIMESQVRVLYDDTLGPLWMEEHDRNCEVGETAAVVRGLFRLGGIHYQRNRFDGRGPYEELEAFEVRAWTDYQILYSTTTRVADAVCVNQVAVQNAAVLSRRVHNTGAVREPQVMHDPATASVHIIFEGGFPNGGQSGADVQAPRGTLLRRELIPMNGHVIIIIPSRTQFPRVRDLHPSPPAAAHISDIPDIFEFVAKFLSPVEILRACQTCRHWRQFRLVSGQQLLCIDEQGEQAQDKYVLHKNEGMSGPDYIWFTACVPRDLQPCFALCKMQFNDQGWGFKKGWVELRDIAPSSAQSPGARLAYSQAEHHLKSAAIWGAIPSDSSVGADYRMVAARDGNPLRKAFMVRYHIGGGGGHSLHVEGASFACLVRLRPAALHAAAA